MKKNIIIAILVLTNIFFVVFSMIKMREAEYEKNRANANLKLSIQLQQSAEAAQAEAEKQAAISIREKIAADKARAAAVQALKDCK